jgi:VWFA-related protein
MVAALSSSSRRGAVPQRWRGWRGATILSLLCATVQSSGPRVSAAQGGQGSASAPAQTPAQPANQPEFRIEASFVRTDVFVTKDGQPVTDLVAGDFEIREDGVPQTIATFERVQIPSRAVQPVERREPSSVAESRSLAGDPRRRVFVLFLDGNHVRRASAMQSRPAMLKFLDQVLGPDDLLAVMTPEMTGSSISFSTKTGAAREALERRLPWGRRDEAPGAEEAEDEKMFSSCYLTKFEEPLYRTLRERRREKQTMDALEDLIAHLQSVREERKAILVLSEGWRLFREDPRLMTVTDSRVPGPPPVGVDPASGRLGTFDRRQVGGVTEYDCDAERLRLANAETYDQFHSDIIGSANRTNASFYTIDPRGLAAFDLSIEEPAAGDVQYDRALLRQRLDTLRTLASATDGTAVVDSNDLARGLKRVADDLSFYYLIGYNSTNAKQDGGYRRIKVAVKRAGVEVRAREGYRATKAGDRRNVPPGTAAPAVRPKGENEGVVTAALSRITPPRPGSPVSILASAGTGPGGTALVRVVAELDAAVAQTPEWLDGQVQVTVRAAGGETVGAGEAPLAPDTRSVVLDVPITGSTAGDLRVQVRLSGSGSLARHSDARTVTFDASAAKWGAPLVLRRGPSTGTAFVPTADLRFRRQERIRVELPTALTSVEGALVDRTGKPLGVPVRLDVPGGGKPVIAEVSLAPLAAGDYAILFRDGEERLAVPLRIIP